MLSVQIVPPVTQLEAYQVRHLALLMTVAVPFCKVSLMLKIPILQLNNLH